MTSLRSIQDASLLSDFIDELRKDEQALSRFDVPAYHLKLYDDGKLGVDAKNLSGRFAVSEKALTDMAQIAEIHGPFFLKKCDTKLRSIVFNYLFRQKTPP